jgi:hypothetical protein
MATNASFDGSNTKQKATVKAKLGARPPRLLRWASRTVDPRPTPEM